MSEIVKRSAIAVPVALSALLGLAAVTPAVGNAAQCGPGTVYDAPTDMCVAAPATAAQWDAAPPPPGQAPAPPPPPALPPISICPPIPFVAVCFPVN